MPRFKLPAAIALAAGLIATPALAQGAPPNYDGDWAGVLEAGGQKLRLELHVKSDGADRTAVLDSLDQGSTIPATAVKIEGGELSILFLSIGGELTGKLSSDGRQIVGAWTQGPSLPLTLTKKAK
ncbi:MAG: hypothetical protein ACXWKN_18300 [Phenylobacterium sp.]